MVSILITATESKLGQRLVPDLESCCDRPDHVVLGRMVEAFGIWGWKSHGVLRVVKITEAWAGTVQREAQTPLAAVW